MQRECEYRLMQWETQRPLSPVDVNNMDAVEDYVRRKEEYDAQDALVRRSIYAPAVRRIERAFRHWQFRRAVQIVKFVYQRHLSQLVEGHLEPDLLASQMYAAKYEKDYWHNGTHGLTREDVTRWWYRKEHMPTVALCADLLRAFGVPAWHPKDITRGKRFTALRALYQLPQTATGFPRTGLNPDGTLCSWALEPKKPFVFPRDVPWVVRQEKRLVPYTCTLGVYFKYETVDIGFGDVYEDDGMWTVVGPAYDVDGSMYTTWYRCMGGRGTVARLQTEIPRGVHKGTVNSVQEIDVLFNHITK